VVEDTSLLMSSINVIGVVLSPITFPCESLTHCNSWICFGPDCDCISFCRSRDVNRCSHIVRRAFSFCYLPVSIIQIM
jgi:hypothetical protein